MTYRHQFLPCPRVCILGCGKRKSPGKLKKAGNGDAPADVIRIILRDGDNDLKEIERERERETETETDRR